MSENIRSGDGGASSAPAFLFDLDGTLVDSVYQHVLAWREAVPSPCHPDPEPARLLRKPSTRPTGSR
jgi:beta-phosphoglucomutase-like phosphatase (HAD superfamily)